MIKPREGILRIQSSLALVLFLAVASSHASAVGWECNISEDKMRGTKSESCEIFSKNTVALPFPYQRKDNRLNLIIRTSGKTRDVILEIGAGQLTTDKSSLRLDEGFAAVKFGGGPVKNFRLQGSTSGHHNLGFIESSASFLKLIEKGGPATIEVHFYQAGRKQFEFDLPPLPAASKK